MVKKKAKKRGVKPGTKRGPYKKVKARRKNKIIKRLDEVFTSNPQYTKLFEAGDAKIRLPNDFVTADGPSVGNLPSIISDLTSTIDTLEAQLTAQIDRIKSILK